MDNAKAEPMQIATLKKVVTIATVLIALLSTAMALAAAQTAAEQAVNRSTNFEKNQVWPIKGRMTMEPCAVDLCLEA